MLTKLARYYLRNDENFKKLDAELDKPEVWQVNDKYTLIHKDGFSLWLASGISFFSVYEPKYIPFRLEMKLALWDKAKKIQRDKWKETPTNLTKILNQIKP